MAKPAETVKKPLPSVDEIASHPAFSTVIWPLQPHKHGRLPITRGKAHTGDSEPEVTIHWEIHGEGPVKMVFINGLGFLKSSWQRQTLYFGHQRASRYSVLLLDNRGIGGSSRPMARYTTSIMARDALAVIDHLGWIAPAPAASSPSTDSEASRTIHICGISMGGMIAQELALLLPAHSVASLNIICSAAAIENTTSFVENLVQRATMLMPKSVDRSIQYTAAAIFPTGYLEQPDDDVELPDPSSTPRYGANTPPLRFGSNYARFAAQEIHKQRLTPFSPEPGGQAGFTKLGFLLQLVACGWHHKSPAQLKSLADRVGRDRILVIHGTEDRMISTPHGRKLIEYLQPGDGRIVEGMGHGPIYERTAWFNHLLEERCQKGEELSGRG